MGNFDITMFSIPLYPDTLIKAPPVRVKDARLVARIDVSNKKDDAILDFLQRYANDGKSQVAVLFQDHCQKGTCSGKTLVVYETPEFNRAVEVGGFYLFDRNPGIPQYTMDEHGVIGGAFISGKVLYVDLDVH